MLCTVPRVPVVHPCELGLRVIFEGSLVTASFDVGDVPFLIVIVSVVHPSRLCPGVVPPYLPGAHLSGRITFSGAGLVCDDRLIL